MPKLQSPCHTCKPRPKDRNNEQCENCRPREEYAVKMGDLSEDVLQAPTYERPKAIIIPEKPKSYKRKINLAVLDEMMKQGKTQVKIAAHFGVTESAVSYAKKQVGYGHYLYGEKRENV